MARVDGGCTPEYLVSVLHGSIPRLLCYVVFASGALSCGVGATNEQLRARFARDFSCPESSVRIVNEGRDVVRAEGCGKTQLYVCVRSPTAGNEPPSHGRVVSEEELRYRSPECQRWTTR